MAIDAASIGLHASAVAQVWDVGRMERETDRLREFGVRLLDVPLGDPHGFDVRGAGAFLSRGGLAAACSAELPAGLDPLAFPDQALEFLSAALAAAAELGCASLGGVAHAAPGMPAGEGGGKARDGLLRFLERAAQEARASGVKLSLQPLGRPASRLLNRARDAVDAIERIGSEHLAVQLDAAVMMAEEVSFASALQAAEPYLVSLYLSESHRGMPGRGMLDWGELFAAADEIGFRGEAVLNAPGLLAPARADDRLCPAEVGMDPLEAAVGFLRVVARR